MTAIISPKPRPTPRRIPRSPVSPLMSPLRLATDVPRRTLPTALLSPLQLLPPIQVPDAKPTVSKVPASCIATKRRRGSANPALRTRRRHCTRPDCCISYCTGGPTMFDQLPWISHVQNAPQRVHDMFDTADLSRSPAQHRSRVGPIRSRKSTLRPDPIAPNLLTATNHSSTPVTPRRSSPTPLLPLHDRELLDPRTPPPREALRPDGIRFFNLMPILPLDDTRPIF